MPAPPPIVLITSQQKEEMSGAFRVNVFQRPQSGTPSLIEVCCYSQQAVACPYSYFIALGDLALLNSENLFFLRKWSLISPYPLPNNQTRWYIYCMRHNADFINSSTLMVKKNDLFLVIILYLGNDLLGNYVSTISSDAFLFNCFHVLSSKVIGA